MTTRIDKPDTRADIELKKCVDNKHCFILTAGAGSGKTTSLIKLLDYIIKDKGKILRKNRQKIACITYTNVAVEEIYNDVGKNDLLFVSTIHSFLWEFIKPFQKDIKKWVASKIDNKINEAEEKLCSIRIKQNTREKLQKDIEKYKSLKDNFHTVKSFKYDMDGFNISSNYEKGTLGHSDIIQMAPQLISENRLLRKILTCQFPYIFIDESQDTFKCFVDSMLEVSKEENICVGFIGDAMQNIYVTGVGKIGPYNNFQEINKEENFRSSRSVLNLANNIRRTEDNLIQVHGLSDIKDGIVKIFICDTNSSRNDNIKKINDYMKDKTSNSWDNIRLLILVHRAASKQMGFQNLYSIFTDSKDEKAASAFSEGCHPLTSQFRDIIFPFLEAAAFSDKFNTINILRNYSPLLTQSNIKDNYKTINTLFLQIKIYIQDLLNILKKENCTNWEILKYIYDKKLFDLHIKLYPYLSLDEAPKIEELYNDANDEEIENHIYTAFLNSETKEIKRYLEYIGGNSIFATQQGVKGAEFDNVMVLIDPEDKHMSFSYGKLLKTESLSNTDQDNIAQGKDNVLFKTKRLFYVACTRARRNLAITYFSDNIDYAISCLNETEFFNKEDIIDTRVI